MSGSAGVVTSSGFRMPKTPPDKTTTTIRYLQVVIGFSEPFILVMPMFTQGDAEEGLDLTQVLQDVYDLGGHEMSLLLIHARFPVKLGSLAADFRRLLVFRDYMINSDIATVDGDKLTVDPNKITNNNLQRWDMKHPLKNAAAMFGALKKQDELNSRTTEVLYGIKQVPAVNWAFFVTGKTKTLMGMRNDDDPSVLQEALDMDASASKTNDDDPASTSAKAKDRTPSPRRMPPASAPTHMASTRTRGQRGTVPRTVRITSPAVTPDQAPPSAEEQHSLSNESSQKSSSTKVNRPRHISSKYAYNEELGFEPFKESFVEYLALNDMHYLVDADFIQQYQRHKSNAVEYYYSEMHGSKLPYNASQVRKDVRILYSFLHQCIIGTPMACVVDSNNKDGIALWMAMLEMADNPMARRQRANVINQAIQRTARHDEPLDELVRSARHAFTQLNALNHPDDRIREEAKTNRLYQLINSSGNQEYIGLVRLSSQTHDPSQFNDICNYFIAEARSADNAVYKRHARKARPVNRRFGGDARANKAGIVDEPPVQGGSDASDGIPDSIRQDKEYFAVVMMAAEAEHERTKRDRYYIDSETFRSLPEDVRTVIRYLRRQANRNRNRQNQKQTQPPAETSTNALPRQYPTVTGNNDGQVGHTQATQQNQRASDDSMVGSYASRSSYDSDYDDDDDASTTYVHIAAMYNDRLHNCMVRICDGPNKSEDMDLAPRRPTPSDPTITIVSQSQSFACNQNEHSNESYAICDSGAQCAILGGNNNAWDVMTSDLHRTYNIVGAVPSTMKKSGLRVVSAQTKVQLEDGEWVIIRVHDAAYNPESSVTLLSEYQLREGQCIVDSVPTCHLRSQSPATYGTQALYTPEGDKIPLDIRGAMMTFDLHEPTLSDIETLRVIDITPVDGWNPKQHNTEPDVSQPFQAMSAVDARKKPDPPSTMTRSHTTPEQLTGATQVLFPFEEPPDGAMSMDEPGQGQVLLRWNPAYMAPNVTKEYHLNDAELMEAQDTDPVSFFLNNLTYDEMVGRNGAFNFDSYGYAAFVSRQFRGDGDLGLHIKAMKEPSQHDVLWMTMDDHIDTTANPDGSTSLCTQTNEIWVDQDGRPQPSRSTTSSVSSHSEVTKPASNTTKDKAISGYDDLTDAMRKQDESQAVHPNAKDPDDHHGDGFRMTAKHNLNDINRVRPYLGWRTARIVQETIKRTTQSCKAVIRWPMIRHLKSRFSWMKHPRLREVVAIDTAFANARAYGEGFSCIQVFFGLSSHMINVYGLRTKENVIHAVKDFLRDEGAPWAFRMDNANEQSGAEVKNVLRDLHIATEHTEPDNQQQNPAELRAVKWLKHHTHVMLDRTGAPPRTWYHAAKYVADVHNITADVTLRYNIPMTMRHGETVDISPFLSFRFYEKVYYHDPHSSFPDPKEKTGYWLGVAHSVGDALTYYILSNDTQRVLTRSVVRPFRTDKENKRLDFNQLLDPDVQHPEPEVPLMLSHERLPISTKLAKYRKPGAEAIQPKQGYPRASSALPQTRLQEPVRRKGVSDHQHTQPSSVGDAATPSPSRRTPETPVADISDRAKDSRGASLPPTARPLRRSKRKSVRKRRTFGLQTLQTFIGHALRTTGTLMGQPNRHQGYTMRNHAMSITDPGAHTNQQGTLSHEAKQFLRSEINK